MRVPHPHNLTDQNPLGFGNLIRMICKVNRFINLYDLLMDSWTNMFMVNTLVD